MVQWVHWDNFLATIIFKPIIRVFFQLKKSFHCFQWKFRINPSRMKFHPVSRYIWIIFSKFFFGNFKPRYSILIIFSIFGYWLPNTIWVSSGCDNVYFYVQHWHNPIWLFHNNSFILISFVFMRYMAIDILLIPWVISYYVIITYLPCSCFLIKYITDVVTNIYIITYMNIDWGHNITTS